MRLKIGRAFVAVALLAAFLATPVLAQGGGRGRGGQGGQGGFGGPGGFGGMGMMGGGGDMMLLGYLRVEAVQKELEMMADQIAAVDKVGEKLREVERPGADFNFREATAEQRAEFGEKMRKFSEEQGKMVSEQLEEILLPEQLERLRQIALQQQGVQAFYDPKFVEKIGLTEDQQAKLKEQQEALAEKMQTTLREAFGGGDREAIGKKMEEIRNSALGDAKDVLTDDQKKKYEEMLGKPFEMPENAMRGGRGFGGPGGPGGQGGSRGGRGGRGGNDNDA